MFFSSKNKNFSHSNLQNDIALLKLKSNAILSEYVQLACLPYGSYIPPNTIGTAVGWGVTSTENGTITDLQREVDLIVYDETACDETIAEVKKDWRSQLCAGDLTGEKDTCQGDSGGPLYVKQTFDNVTKVN